MVRIRPLTAIDIAGADGVLRDAFHTEHSFAARLRRYLAIQPDGWLAGPLFNEPAGLSVANGKLYVADTNAHRIRVVDLKAGTVRTLALKGVEAPSNTSH